MHRLYCTIYGIRSSSPSAKDIEIIQKFGKSIGLAFQVVDDILDIVSTTEQLGKDAGSDEERGKATYPSVIGLEASRERAMALYREAIVELDALEGNTEVLRSIAAFIVTRVN